MADTEGMAKTSTRTMWKGAITFGLVHIPIGLYSATAESDLDFDWLDRRTMDPVGYKRINKKTGEEIAREDIVKGIAVSKGEYVVLSPEEIQQAYPRTTQTIDIETFVDADDVPFVYLERPYYTAPINKGEKVYALLREALVQTGKAGIARVVIQTKQHLAVLLPCGPALVLNLLRWGGEIRSPQDLNLPPRGAKAAGLRENELEMAKQLVEGMAGKWDPGALRDSFRDEIMKLVHAKQAAGETADVAPMEEAPEGGGSNVVDLTELLRRSLQGSTRSAAKAASRSAAPERETEHAEAADGKRKAPARASSAAAKKPAAAEKKPASSAKKPAAAAKKAAASKKATAGARPRAAGGAARTAKAARPSAGAKPSRAAGKPAAATRASSGRRAA